MEEWIEKIERLLPQLQEYILFLQERNKELTAEVSMLKDRLEETTTIAAQYQQQYQSLKIAQTLLGSDETKTEAKLKIGRLIREIEQCIVQLSQH